MRICLVIAGALVLVATATAFIDSESYRYPNDEDSLDGLLTLVSRETKPDGSRHCTILDRSYTKAFRNLYPLYKYGEKVQVVRRSLLDEEFGDINASNDLFELNLNVVEDWDKNHMTFLRSECDYHVDDTITKDEDDDNDPRDMSHLGQEWGQQVLGEPFQARHKIDETRKVVDNGPDRNRVSIVFMGDGYTLQERVKFFSDIQRLVDDMFLGDTFKSPSNESGIGVGGKWKDTSFRLYRDGTELRGIYTANPNAARQACRALGTYACDFPSLIGNDPYYGGLGGEFVISTSSNKSGTIVLRHELGHSLIDIGEEYDGGDVYEGVNAERWSIQNIKWKHWLTDPVPREEKNILRVQDYSWYDLKNGSYVVNFESDGQWKRWGLKVSHSGVDTDDSFEVYLDGKRLEWTSPGGFDRDFSEWSGNESFSAGVHKIEFREGEKYNDEPVDPSRPIRQLCSVTLHEFMGEDQYRFNNSIISAYPTYDRKFRKTWRSNNEHCLMRNMASTQFCSVCKEGLWHRLLSKVSLLEEIQVTCQRNRHGHQHGKRLVSFGVEAKVIRLGQFREDLSTRAKDEVYTARWFRDGVHQARLDDQFKIKVAVEDEGIWQFQTEFKTSEVRKDPRGLLKANKVTACTFKSLAIIAAVAVAVSAQAIVDNPCSRCVKSAFPNVPACVALVPAEMQELQAIFADSQVNVGALLAAAQKPTIKACLCNWATNLFGPTGAAISCTVAQGATPAVCSAAQIAEATAKIEPLSLAISCPSSTNSAITSSVSAPSTAAPVVSTSSPNSGSVPVLNTAYTALAVAMAAMAGL
ncbi:hypothetical protein BGZ65_006314 [Modicella reniformis]|uniref:IgA peptidase M64-domain-containing protein n=1 Tax=Modicella reniformis TaxID=1440133 RepID=A0A9P6JHF1_9FUNG|nr:hypothetical protein BGZ65_006314 [Modicella reniformis]